MPYLKRATDNPFGFQPHDAVLRTTAYVKDSDAAAIYPGDAVVLANDGHVEVAAAADTNILGVAAMYSAASTQELNFLVYDHPDQLFVVQDDSDTTHIAETNIGNNGDIVATTGDTTLLRSRHELDSSNVAATTTATAQVRVIGQHPVEERSFATAAGSPRKWIVKFNEHLYASTTGI